MIRLLSFAFLCSGFAAFAILNGLGAVNEDEERNKLWDQVEEDIGNGLPKSAIEKLKTIYEGATDDEEFAEAAKALCQRFLMEGQIDQPVQPYVIRALQATLPETPESMQPILKTILAEWYYGYYMQNQWQFQQRSQTSAAPGDDFETWDLATILGEVDKRFTEALAAAEELKKIPIASYDQLLDEGGVSDAHRPTLYDFIAFEALQFYSLDEQFIRGQGAFEVTADSPVFASSSEFVNWKPDTSDTDSYVLKAIKLYQDVLRFHENDTDRTAWLDADLMRLMFGRSVAKGDESAARYQAVLQRFSDENIAHPLSSSALALLATSIKVSGDNVRALAIAEQGMSRFPESVGGRQCHNVIQEIRQKSSSVTTERVWHSMPATVDVRYRNVEKVWFRLVEFDYEGWKQWGDFHTPQNIYGDAQAVFMKRRAVAEWSADLPRTEDFKERVQAVTCDVDAKPGCYVLLCSHNAAFDRTDNTVYAAEVWISNLAVVLRRENDGRDVVQGHVFDATTGEPQAGVNVRKASWKYDGRNSKEVDVRKGRTDKDGFFTIASQVNGLCKLTFQTADQNFGLVDNFYSGSRSMARPFERTILFTDRAIYRPGQTIQFKGICVRSDQEKNDYRTLTGKSVTVVLHDANNEEVERKEFRTNEFGSFAGSFVAPRNRVTGNMQMRCESAHGAASVRVEEYKRPKFYVEVEKPDEAFQLGQQVKTTGKALAYTGAPIDGAKVAWRVVREVRYPSWYSWRYWYMPANNESQEIAHGVMESDVEGKFVIEFTAEPDLSVSRENEPIFSYSVYADVTDTTGETRSASQTTRVGYTSLAAALTSKDWQTTQNAVEISLNVTTLDGEGQESAGKLAIYALTPPEKVHSAKLSANYWYGVQPADVEPDLSRISSWATGDEVHSEEIATDVTGKNKASVMLEAGAYKAVYETKDSSGLSVKSEIPIVVQDTESERFAIRIPHHFQVKAASVEPGEEFMALWGTGYDGGRAFVEFEHRGKVFQSYWTGTGRPSNSFACPSRKSTVVVCK